MKKAGLAGKRRAVRIRCRANTDRLYAKEVYMEESRIKAVVVRSGCPLYAVGDAVYFDGPLLDKGKSGNLCMMALNAIFPFVYAARKGVLKETPVQCPDCEEHVEFMLQAEPRD